MTPQKRCYFPTISSRSWQHPADTAALEALKKIPGLSQVTKAVLSITSDRSLRLFFLGSAVRVTERQFPRIHALAKEACSVLDYDDKLDIFVTYNPAMNAGAVGVDRPFVTLNSALVSSLDDEELLTVIGHELGHCMSGHILYKTLLWVLVNVSFKALRIPGLDLLIIPVMAGLREWDRKSELSADRAGLLVCQDQDVSFRLLMKLAGGNDIGQMDINEFFSQAAEYDAGESVIDSLHKFLNTWDMSHPLPVIRIPELKRWVDDGSFGRIYGGDYLKRGGEAEEKNRDYFKEARQQYESDFEETRDPAAGFAKHLGKALGDLGKEGGKIVRDIFDQFDQKGRHE